MEYRSTNDIGYVHFQGDLVAGVGSSHAVQLSGGSTGGLIQPVGDDTSISLSIRAKNAGTLNIGSATSAILALNSTLVDLQSTRIQIGDISTTGLQAVDRYLVQIDSAAMVLAAGASGDTVSTQAGLTTNCVLVITPHATFSSRYEMEAFCSTATELRIRLINRAASTFGSGESSNRVNVLGFMF